MLPQIRRGGVVMAGDPIIIPVVVMAGSKSGDPISIPGHRSGGGVEMAGSNIGGRLEAGPRPRPAHWREAAVPTRVLTIPGLGTRGPGHVTRVAAASPDSAAAACLGFHNIEQENI